MAAWKRVDWVWGHSDFLSLTRVAGHGERGDEFFIVGRISVSSSSFPVSVMHAESVDNGARHSRDSGREIGEKEGSQAPFAGKHACPYTNTIIGMDDISFMFR